MAMLALAIGDDTISSQARREAIIDGLFDLPSMFKILLMPHVTLIETVIEKCVVIMIPDSIICR